MRDLLERGYENDEGDERIDRMLGKTQKLVGQYVDVDGVDFGWMQEYVINNDLLCDENSVMLISKADGINARE